MRNVSFRQLLTTRQLQIDSLVCVGLDPLEEKIPKVVLEASTSVGAATLLWMWDIVNATAPYASMFKAQSAHWEAIPGGIDALRILVSHIHLHHPEIPVFKDVKRGDIDRTQTQYRDAHFILDGVDGLNYNSYMGEDTLKALINLKFPGRALVGLGRTSNPKAWRIQDQMLTNGMRVWEDMVSCILEWSTTFGVLEDAGVVMGAAHKDPNGTEAICSEHLRRAREITGNKLWYLLPGIGTQGGYVEQTIEACFEGPGSVAVNNSSAINFASSGPDYAFAAARAAKDLRDQIHAAGGRCSLQATL